MPKDGVLTHEEMTNHIKSGRSVLHQGRVITELEELPSPDELLGNDLGEHDDLIDDLDSQIELLTAERHRVSAKRNALQADFQTTRAAKKQTAESQQLPQGEPGGHAVPRTAEGGGVGGGNLPPPPVTIPPPPPSPTVPTVATNAPASGPPATVIPAPPAAPKPTGG